MRLLYRIRDHCHVHHNPGKARRGMTLVESIIAIIVVFVVIVAVLTTVAMSAQMLARSREDLGIHTLATNWFEMLEAQDPDILSSDFSLAVGNASKALAPDATGSGTTYTLDGYTLTATRGALSDGIVTVSISMKHNSGTKQQPMRFEKTFNTISNATVTNEYAQTGFEG